MSKTIETICLASVNSYLLAVDDGFVLIDTGRPEKREALDARLTSAGCEPGDLKLIVITHGDYDHAGNAAYLREKHGCTIAMHRSDAGRVMKADWRLGMKPKPDKFPLVFRIASFFIRPGHVRHVQARPLPRRRADPRWTSVSMPPCCICRATRADRSAC